MLLVVCQTIREQPVLWSSAVHLYMRRHPVDKITGYCLTISSRHAILSKEVYLCKQRVWIICLTNSVNMSPLAPVCQLVLGLISSVTAQWTNSQMSALQMCFGQIQSISAAALSELKNYICFWISVQQLGNIYFQDNTCIRNYICFSGTVYQRRLALRMRPVNKWHLSIRTSQATTEHLSLRIGRIVKMWALIRLATWYLWDRVNKIPRDQHHRKWYFAIRPTNDSGGIFQKNQSYQGRFQPHQWYNDIW